jgi:hypothetical protein
MSIIDFLFPVGPIAILQEHHVVSGIETAAQGFEQSGWTGLLHGAVSLPAKQDMISSETNDLIKASAGTLSPDQAQAIATQDITGQLVAAGADPSQVQSIFSGSFSDIKNVFSKIVGGGETLIIAAIVILALILLIKIT